jgi:hypothetical protein
MIAAIRSSVALVLLWEPGVMESARWEAGIALGQRLPVFVAGDVDLFYGYTPTVKVFASDEEAVDAAIAAAVVFRRARGGTQVPPAGESLAERLARP